MGLILQTLRDGSNDPCALRAYRARSGLVLCALGSRHLNSAEHNTFRSASKALPSPRGDTCGSSATRAESHLPLAIIRHPPGSSIVPWRHALRCRSFQGFPHPRLHRATTRTPGQAPPFPNCTRWIGIGVGMSFTMFFEEMATRPCRSSRWSPPRGRGGRECRRSSSARYPRGHIGGPSQNHYDEGEIEVAETGTAWQSGRARIGRAAEVVTTAPVRADHRPPPV